MALEMTKDTMTWKQRKGTHHSRILLEGDMIVPDNRPDVAQVLHCSGTVRLDEVKSGEEKINLTGELMVRVLYRAAGGEKPVYAMTSSLPIQEVLYVEGMTAEDAVNVMAETEHLECQLINDRKVGLRAIVEVWAEAEGSKSLQTVSGAQGEAVELLRKKVLTERPVAEKKDRFTVKHTVSLGADQPNIGEMLHQVLTLSDTDIRAMDGKVAVRGNLRLTAIYGTEENGMPVAVEAEIPFHGFIEGGSITPQTWTDVKLTVNESEVRPAVNDDGETRNLDVTAVIGAELKAVDHTEQEMVTDAYGLESCLQPKREKVTFPVCVGMTRSRFSLKEGVSLENGEMPMMQAVAAWGQVHTEDVTVETDAVHVEGVLQAEILYLSADDDAAVCVLKRGIPFRQTVEVRGAKAGDTACVRSIAEQVDFRLMTETEGELRAQILLEILVTAMEETEVVTDLLEMPEETPEKRPSAVICVVQDGESLWDIAKKYRTTPERILMVNDIENPERLFSGQKLLILRGGRK